MKLKSLNGRRVWPVAFAALLLSLSVARTTQAQEEGVPIVVDEVIAQVNNDVVTLSMLKREMGQAVEALKARGMDAKQASEEVEKSRAKIIANLINERLVMQKGKEIPRLTEDVEAEVNREMLRVAKQQGISSIEQLDEELRKAKFDPVEIRQTLRTQFTRQAVLQREVDAKIYFGLTDEEMQKYFAANREKFRKPESVELSEIFLSLAGKPEADVRAKAARIVAQARGGADFAQLAVTHSEREVNGQRVAAENKGKVGRFELPDLRPELVAALKNVPKGGVTEPVKLEEGLQIIRVDERAGSAEPVFNEQSVRGAITQERAPKEQEDYMKKLRSEAYVKLAPAYESLVLPLMPEVNAQSTASTDDAAPKKGTNKKP
ncbi:MAG TPA: peptidylprolyl isomerase [Pyrinomonadaceae bacterium]|nr:peptidylprolyl isomerase [Pyrinomonadaceae bacterium]